MSGLRGPPAAAPRGAFITLEGGEGAGKSTLARALGHHLSTAGIPVRLTREPGGSPRAEAIREGLLAGDAAQAGAFAEAVLFSAARIDHLDTLIAPTLAAGTWVICDRFADSTRAYQGASGQLEPDLIRALEQAVVREVRPDLTLIVDIPVEEGLARARARAGAQPHDRFEREGIGFHVRLREAYLAIAASEPQRCAVLDGQLAPEELARAALAVLRERLGARWSMLREVPA